MKLKINPIQVLIDNNIDFCIIGGYCRYLLGIEKEFKDIDIVTNTDIDLFKLFPYATKNIYGGVMIKNPDFDIWDIKNNIIPSKTFDELYDNYFISYDAIMYNPRTNKWWLHNFDSRVIRINEKVIYKQVHKFNIEKMLKLFKRKGILLSEKAIEYIENFKGD